jgi:CMP-N,N'-diacetyllegionaminic acid synthase
MAKVVALIPARAGSKGIPNKNVRLLGGHPLLAWSIAACCKSVTIDCVIVSTDSSDYAELAKELGAKVPFLRPQKISGDNSPDYEFIIHALDWFASNGGEPDFLVHIRPTTPIRDPRFIDDAVRDFIDAPYATALRSVQIMSESAYKTFEITPDGNLKSVASDGTALDGANDARQQFPDTYHANGYVDVLSSSFIRKTGLIHGDKVKPFVTPSVVEIDTEEDFSHLEYQLTLSAEITQELFN